MLALDFGSEFVLQTIGFDGLMLDLENMELESTEKDISLNSTNTNNLNSSVSASCPFFVDSFDGIIVLLQSVGIFVLDWTGQIFTTK